MQCQLFTGVMPLSHQYALRAMGFYSNLEVSANTLCREIFLVRGMHDVNELVMRYGCEKSSVEFCKQYRYIVTNQFRAAVAK